MKEKNFLDSDPKKLARYNSRKVKNEKAKKSVAVQIGAVIAATVCILLLLLSAVAFYFEFGYLNQITVIADEIPTDDENLMSNHSSIPGIDSVSDSELKDIDIGTAHKGLYRDSAVMNILLLGVDDYQPGDIGRSDTQLMVSIDTKRNKIKLTSFMRDTYVQIPGYASNRINVAFTLGGAPLTMRTIESNFGVDIDRYVIVDFDGFTRIIDALGGVEITLTQGEADLVNTHSGESGHWLTAGTYNLTGKQARYYSRIRAIGNDQERTARQRKVITSILNKLKESDLLTLNDAVQKCLAQITTNISKNEILALAANLPHYLKYEIVEFRVPAEGLYYGDMVSIGGVGASVLIPDLKGNSQKLIDFLYEDDIPELN